MKINEIINPKFKQGTWYEVKNVYNSDLIFESCQYRLSPGDKLKYIGKTTKDNVPVEVFETSTGRKILRNDSDRLFTFDTSNCYQ